jgi:serine/threonine-protein kinase
MALKKKIIPHFPAQIGKYKVLKSLGRGGMGEVLLCYDPLCDRQVALKRIRPDMQHLRGIKERFLKEAKIASQLPHPSIIPIYSIHEEDSVTYYTMAYVDGKTLKKILQEAKTKEDSGDFFTTAEGSISELCRFFLNICEAIAFTHENGFLHRDLKPENFIIGKYGEVRILDWGIAEKIDICQKHKPNLEKVAGTLTYLAPERILKNASTELTDIYSLGAILYQILTLKPPFQRTSLAHFRKIVGKEVVIDPIELAPYREIPHALCEITKKCLAYDSSGRYQSVQELIHDLKKVIEGKPKWTFMTHLSIKNKKDWEFQENIFLTKHLAITQSLDFLEWVSFMVSKYSYFGNIRLETEITFHNKQTGIGFLFSIPEVDKRASLEEGYHLWISPTNCRLYRNNVLVLETSAFIDQNLNQKLFLRIEKTDHQVRFYRNDKLIINYFSYLPLAGTHIGILHKDAEFELEELRVYSGSHTVHVNCLAVPDAFLIHKQFDTAINEYRRIGSSFPGRAEGREALFRAGLTLLEKSKLAEEKDKESFYNQALDEFEKLRITPGAPLEYLGKSLVYVASNEPEEESKCLELALRKYPKHPILNRIQDHILYRIHESSVTSKEASYRHVLLAIRFFPNRLEDSETKSFLSSLEKNLEPLYFFEKNSDIQSNLSIQLAFWIGKKETLLDLLEKYTEEQLLTNILFSLLELGFEQDIKKYLPSIKEHLSPIKTNLFSTLVDKKISTLEKYQKLIDFDLDAIYLPFVIYLLEKAIDERDFEVLRSAQAQLEGRFSLDHIWFWTDLLEYKQTTRQITNNLLPFLHLCYLQASGKNEELEKKLHLEETSHRQTPYLLNNFLIKKSKNNLFPWEKKQLSRQLNLYNHIKSSNE